MIGAINGGGKTVLSNQLAHTLGDAGFKVAVFTTEDSPMQLMFRMTSRACKISISELISGGADLSNQLVNTKNSVQTYNVPLQYWNSPIHRPALDKLHSMLRSNVCCVDWTVGGLTPAAHLDQELQALASVGFPLDVIILDWVGGALTEGKEKDQRRLAYEDTVNFMVRYGKERDLIVIVVAQIDKVAAKNRTLVTMDMLSECKTMSNNIQNFWGLSSLTETADNRMDGRPRLLRKQFINVDKCRYGQGGPVAVQIDFEHQSIETPKDGNHGNGLITGV